MKFSKYKILTYFFVLCSVIQCTHNSTEDDFKWPEIKPEHKPGIYWWWMGSAVDKENLTYNLTKLSEGGFGTAHIVPIYGVEGEEENYINFLSPEWMEMLAFTAQEAKRFDMNLDMSTTTGWPFGGSHVTPKYAASKLEFEIFNILEGEKINAKLDSSSLEAVIAYSMENQMVDLSGALNQEGILNWEAPKVDWEVYVLYKKGTEQKVKRAAPGNLGLVLDPFSVEAIKEYLSRYDTAFVNYTGGKIRAQYHDSYEYYNAIWTKQFFREFQNRNGYDLRLQIPQLLNPEQLNPRIKADYRRTLAELHLEYIETWNNWSHSKGWITRNEAHGAPANLLDLYAASDIPETETFGSRKFNIPGITFVEENNSKSVPPHPLILKFASSAAHVSGKPLIASETGTWLRDHYNGSLSQLKPEIDELFYCGINHLFYHGNAYSPKDAEWPGWIFYASTHFEKENAIWRDLPELNTYVARCQSVLQSGSPDNDILLYWPLEDVYHSYPELSVKTLGVHNIDWFLDFDFGKLAVELEEKGYSFDYISDKQLQNVTKVNKSFLSGKNYYKTILIPETKYIPLATLKHLKQLAAEGGTILFHTSLPLDIPGFGDIENRREKFRTSLSELEFNSFTQNDIKKAKIGDGYFLISSDVPSVLKYENIKNEQITEYGINYIRRKHETGYNYFLTNLSDRKLDSWIPLSVEFESALIYDPRYSDRIGSAAVRENDYFSEIYLQIQPGESFIVKTFSDEIIEYPKWQYLNQISEPVEINGEWEVDFIDGGPVLPSIYSTSELSSWTNHTDSAALSFAGTASYSITFNLPEIIADDWLLDLGKVNESAKIIINGFDTGKLWSVPFNISIGEYLKEGENILTIEVTNLSANRIRDLDRRGIDWKKFFFVNVFYKDFDASGWPLMDSGLTGPVTLIPQKFITFNE